MMGFHFDFQFSFIFLFIYILGLQSDQVCEEMVSL